MEDKTVTMKFAKFYKTGNFCFVPYKKTPVSVDNIGTLDKEGKSVPTQKVLIEGAPGVGKTTLMWRLCRDWANQTLLQRFSLVVMLQLREKQVSEAKSLEDLLYYPEANISHDVAQRVIGNRGKGLLLIFDGYDEVPQDVINGNKLIMKVLIGEALTSATIIVTSRSFATGKLPGPFLSDENLQHIEVMGFDEPDIDEYVTAACEDRSTLLLESFRKYLLMSPFIKAIMYNPLHCTIVTELYIWNWVEDGGDTVMPKTRTELYTYLVTTLLVYNNPTYQISPSTNFEQLDKLPELMDQLLCHGKLAASGIDHHEYIFKGTTCKQLGLLQPIGDLLGRMRHKNQMSSKTSYSFLHLTLQEFLAAFFWSRTFSPPELEGKMSYSSDFPLKRYLDMDHGFLARPNYEKPSNLTHWPVLLFLSGLTEPESLPLKKFVEYKPNRSQTYREFRTILHLCHLLFEVQNKTVTSTVMSEGFYNVSSLALSYRNDLDWFIVGHCIAHSGVSTEWEIILMDEVHLEFLQKGLRYSPRERKGGSIKYLRLCTCEGTTTYNLHPYAIDVEKLEICFWPDLNPYPFPENITVLFPNLSHVIVHTYTLAILDFTRQLTYLKRLVSVEINLGDCFVEDVLHNKVLNIDLPFDTEKVKSAHTSSLASQVSSTLLCKMGHLRVTSSISYPWIDSSTGCHLLQISCGKNSVIFCALQNAIKDNISVRGLIDEGSSLNTTITGASIDTMNFGCQLEHQSLESICMYNETSIGFDVHCTPAT